VRYGRLSGRCDRGEFQRVAPGKVMAKTSKPRAPKDRTGRKFRCYRVVKTIPRDPNHKHYLLKCTECGAKGRAKYYADTGKFTPMPCKCGSHAFSRLKVGEIRNNKEILRIKKIGHHGSRAYEVLVRCLNCGAMSVITNLNQLTAQRNRPQLRCRHCVGESLSVRYLGRQIGAWEIVDEDRKWMTCMCLECGNRIVMRRNNISAVASRKCRACFERRRKVDKNKIIYILSRAGYSYNAIAEYFEMNPGTVMYIAGKVAKRYEAPEKWPGPAPRSRK
jgi:hypothetical protein